MRKKAAAVLIAACCAAPLSAVAATYGWVERATIEPWGVKVKAKLDSGALTSSMHAENIEHFTRGDEQWVRFTVQVEDQSTQQMVERVFTKPVHRNILVRGAGGEDRRPVVLMKLCIGDTVYQEQFSLTDRDDKIYPVLLGRRTIQSLGPLDVTRTFLHEPECDADSRLITLQEKELDEDIGV